MDLSNLKGLLETDQSNSPDVSDDDLEDELNAILSGKSVPQKQSKATVSSAPTASVANVKRVKQNDSRQSTSGQMAKRGNRSIESTGDHQQDIFSPHMLNIDNLNAFDDHIEDDEDVDENDEDLLSEISAIATSKPVVKHKTSLTSHTNQSAAHPHHIVDQPCLEPIRIEQKRSSENPEQARVQTVTIPQPTPLASISTDQKRTPNKISNINEVKASHESSSKPNKVTEEKNDIPRLNALKDNYRRAALMAKKNGQQEIALSHIKTAKQIEVLIKALEEGSAVDLSELPPPPSMDSLTPPSTHPQQTSERPSGDDAESNAEFEAQIIEMTSEDVKKFFNAPPPPNSVMEALEQRLNKFKSTLEQANSENNTSKARRLGRIVKQYENAIKDFKKGKTMDFDELPTPPGFGPIPVANEAKPVVIADPTGGQVKQASVVRPAPPPPSKVNPNRPQVTNKSTESPSPSGAKSAAKGEQRPALKRASSTANKQLNYLLERQRLFKEAALESKQKGDIQQAKEYLRMAKGFDPLIEATQNGLPIDATSIPTPPQMNEDFVVVSHPELTESDDLEREELFRKIEVELQNQIEMCKRNKEYFIQLGDISTSSKFEKYAADSRKDLDLVTIRWRNGQKVPNVKYETRTFSIVICNTEVSTNEVSVEVVKALDIPAKSEVDTYVRLEFPFPNDRIQTARTRTVKNSNNPVFNETLKFEIDRKARQLPRVFKRHPLKLELMSKGGFLRSDSLLGTVLIKLNDFESKCTIHESFPLTEGKKVIGGRIEAKVKIREPLLAKQVEEVKEKWLSIV